MTYIKETRTIGVELAQAAVAAGMAHAETAGSQVGIAVVGVAGDLVAYARMDGASLLAEPAARDKAYTTAVTGGYPTEALGSMIPTMPAVAHGIASMDRMIIFGGGVPITAGGVVVGAVGVSGAPSPDQDAAIAQHAAEHAQTLAEGEL